MAENDAKKKEKMIGSATDHHQNEGDSDDSVNQGDPGDSSIMKEDDAKKEKLKKMSSISYHLQKDGNDDSSRLALMNEDGPSDAMEMMNGIISTPKKRKEPTTSTETPSKIRKIRKEKRGTGPSKATTAATVKRYHKINVKVPKKVSSAVAVGGAAAAENNSSDSDASSVMLIEGQGYSSPTTGLLPKTPPETDGKN